MAAPDERDFTTFPRGHVRDNIILEGYRNALRFLINTKTGLPFSEDEIQRATQQGTRFYIDADATDLFGQAMQKRALHLSDQIDPRRANSTVLRDQHGNLWLGPNSVLPAVGASGIVDAPGNAGTIYVGSTTLGDPAAAVATDPNGNRYQVLVTSSIPVGEASATLSLQGVLPDGSSDGFVTNIPVDTILTWSLNIPLGTDPTATVLDSTGTGVGFAGGFDTESDQEYAVRIEDRIRSRPASGNPAHFQAWTRQASVAVEQSFIYPCAFQAGSVLVAPLQKRNPNASPPAGPLARVPSIGLLTTVASFITAPNSPVVPQRVFVVTTTTNFELADQIERITMGQGISGGWFNVEPWPNPEQPVNPALTEQVVITTLTDQQNFTLTTTSLLPNQVPSVSKTLSGDDAPSIMAWNRDLSRFERLIVTSIEHDGVNLATVVLATAPVMTLVDSATPATATRISPYTDRLEIIAESFENYFDSLGPGQVVADTDPRFVRAARHPQPQVGFPIRAGQAVIARLLDDLGGIASDGELSFISQNEPALPGNINDGPNIIGLGSVNIYPLS
jgi:hypothetical protein